MASENTNPFATQNVPNLTLKVVITGEQKAARNGERDRGDATEDLVILYGGRGYVSSCPYSHSHMLNGRVIGKTYRVLI
jgi:hypothetical protein